MDGSEKPESGKPGPGKEEGGGQLSGITFVYLVGIGFQIFVLLFIFAKRQIMRLAWNSRREPHAPIGSGAANWMNKKIADNISTLNSFKYEAKLEGSSFNPDSGLQYRLLAMSEVQGIKESFREAGVELLGRSLFTGLMAVRDSHLPTITENQVARFAVLYELARHSPQKRCDWKFIYPQHSTPSIEFTLVFKMSYYPGKLARAMKAMQDLPRFMWKTYPEMTVMGTLATLSVIFCFPGKYREERERRIYSRNYLVYRQDDPSVPLIRPHEHYPEWQTFRETCRYDTNQYEAMGEPYTP